MSSVNETVLMEGNERALATRAAEISENDEMKTSVKSASHHLAVALRVRWVALWFLGGSSAVAGWSLVPLWSPRVDVWFSCGCSAR